MSAENTGIGSIIRWHTRTRTRTLWKARKVTRKVFLGSHCVCIFLFFNTQAHAKSFVEKTRRPFGPWMFFSEFFLGLSDTWHNMIWSILGSIMWVQNRAVQGDH